MAWSLLLALLVPLPDAGDRLVRAVGRLQATAIREASGIVASRRHAGVFWVHNDSANPPRLFAVDRAGALIREYAVNVPNVDWEDIAADGRGHLYLGDIGNNDGRLPLRAIHQLDEPDPRTPAEAGKVPTLRVRTTAYYRFGPAGRFDAEGLAVDGTRALLTSKTFDGRDAEVFAVPLDPPAPLLRPATPERVGTLSGFTRPVTGADLSADGRRLAVCATDAVGVYERGPGDRWRPLWVERLRGGDGRVEAIAWDGDDLVLASEGRELYRIPTRVP